MKRPRMDVNLDELDRVLDHAREVPLSEPDYDKLKSALHALAGMLPQPRSTEKTKAVLEQPETRAPKNDADKKPGHGRNGAASYTGAKKVAVSHPSLHTGDACPGCEKGKVYPQKEPRVLVRVVGQAHWRRRYMNWIVCAVICVAKCSRPKNRKAWVRKSTTKPLRR